MPENSRRGVAVVHPADCGRIPLNVVGLLLNWLRERAGNLQGRIPRIASVAMALLVLRHRWCPHKTPRPGSPQPWPAPRPASALASAR